MMDDDQLLYRNNVTQTRTLVTMRSMGVDAVRATVLWRIVAEGADLTNREIERIKGDARSATGRARSARASRPTDPRTYPTRNWDRYDNLVKEAAKLGMRVYFTITGPGPRYAHKIAPPSQRRNAGTYRPYPVALPQLRRGRRQALLGHVPRRERDPQARCRACRCGRCGTSPTSPAGCRRSGRRSTAQIVPVAPMLYRELHQAGVQGLERSGHGNDADPARRDRAAGLGQDRARATACGRCRSCARCSASSADGTPYDGADAARRRCQDFVEEPDAEGDRRSPTTRTRRRPRRRSRRSTPTRSRSPTSARSARCSTRSRRSRAARSPPTCRSS